MVMFLARLQSYACNRSIYDRNISRYNNAVRADWCDLRLWDLRIVRRHRVYVRILPKYVLSDNVDLQSGYITCKY